MRRADPVAGTLERCSVELKKRGIFDFFETYR